MYIYCIRPQINKHVCVSVCPCGQPGYVFRDFCLKQGIKFIFVCGQPGYVFRDFCLNQGIDFSIFVLDDKQQNFYKLLLINIRVKCLKQGIKNRNSVLNRVGKSAIFVLNRVRV